MLKHLEIVSIWVCSSYLILSPFPAGAWGRIGHRIVAETAGELASRTNGAWELKDHVFDLGYYANVPDFIWKRPVTYAVERPEHFLDFDVFERRLSKRPDVKRPFDLDRRTFEKTFPEIKPEDGRAFWRIRELTAKLEKAAEELRAQDKKKPGEVDKRARYESQGRWLLLAGLLGHYVGDLSMPLHLSEDYDGESTGQKGIHRFFEDYCVNENSPALQNKVLDLAAKRWPEFTRRNGEKNVVDLMLATSERSMRAIKDLLAIDRNNSRAKIAVTCRKFEPMILERLTDSSLLLAELYRRNLGWTMDNERFYLFFGEPEYIKPGE